jgi:uncharacterized membrane protein YdjX (TVP38/TMEM64 family)
MAQKIISIAAGLALVAVLSGLWLLFYHYWQPLCGWGGQAASWCVDKGQVRTWLESWGSLAPLVFILVQACQVLTPLPLEITGFLGGFVFGVKAGLLFSTLGITLGSSLLFGLGRWLEIHLIERWVRRETLEKFALIIERRGALAAFCLFLLPGAPKRSLCLILGMGGMPFKVFLPIVTLGRLPATFLLTLQGAEVYQGNYLVPLLLLALLMSAAAALLAYREKLYHWLRGK